ncbi:MAG: hypothetical protein Q9219_002539 [cf. Caloplaca sp. 3 TL-2023]
MTIETCTAVCKGNNFRYAGIEYYGECYCGNSIRGVQAADNACTFQCTGNKTQTCGGNKLVSVFMDPAYPPSDSSDILDYTPEGCYTEGYNGRAVAFRQDQLSSTNLTTKGCLSACKSQYFPLAATEYGGECYCGVVLGNGTASAPDSDCSTKCTGDSTEICGGRSRLNLYVASDLMSTEPCSPFVLPPPIVKPSSTTSQTQTSTLPATPSGTSSLSSTIPTDAATSSEPTTTSSIESSTSQPASSPTPNPETTTSQATTSESSASETTTAQTLTPETTLETSTVPTTTYESTSLQSTTSQIPPPETTTSQATTPESSASETITSQTFTPETTPVGSSTLETSTAHTITSESTSLQITTSSASTVDTTSPITAPTSKLTTIPTSSKTSTSSTKCIVTSTPSPTCEFGCGKWCSKPIPVFSDHPSCKIAVAECILQIADCFLSAGWPASLQCAKYQSWCQSISSYCGNVCLGSKCSKSDCVIKNPPVGGQSVTTSTAATFCPASTSKVVTTSTSSTAPVPTVSSICILPNGPSGSGYSNGNCVGSIQPPALTCNNLYKEFVQFPLKLYTSKESSECTGYSRGDVPQACKDACLAQYNSCVGTYATGCKGQKQKGEQDSYESAKDKCSNQYRDCIAINKDTSVGNRCKSFGAGWS